MSVDPIREAVMAVAAASAPDVLPQKLDMALAIYLNLLFDMPLSVPQCADTGVRTDDHYRALSNALTAEAAHGQSIPQIIIGLARRIGNGPELTAWTRTYWPEGPQFETVQDYQLGPPDQPDMSADYPEVPEDRLLNPNR